MPYPASTQSLQVWMTQVDQYATGVKTAAQAQVTLSNASTIDVNSIKWFFDTLVNANNFFTAAAAVSGLAAYAQAQKGDASLAAEFTAMQSAIVNTLNWIRSNLPTGSFNSTSYALAYFFPTDNVTLSSNLTFTAAQTASYRTVLTSLISTIS